MEQHPFEDIVLELTGAADTIFKFERSCFGITFLGWTALDTNVATDPLIANLNQSFRISPGDSQADLTFFTMRPGTTVLFGYETPRFFVRNPGQANTIARCLLHRRPDASYSIAYRRPTLPWALATGTVITPGSGTAIAALTITDTGSYDIVLAAAVTAAPGAGNEVILADLVRNAVTLYSVPLEVRLSGQTNIQLNDVGHIAGDMWNVRVPATDAGATRYYAAVQARRRNPQ